MSYLAGQYMMVENVMGQEAEPQIATKKKICFIDLLRPPHCQVIFGLHVTQSFELFRWMVATGKDYRSDYPGQGVWECLNLKPTCVNSDGIEPFFLDWKSDLRKRIHAAILEAFVHSSVWRWRDDYQITPEGVRMVPMRYYTPVWESGPSDAKLCKLLDDIFNTSGTLTKSFNSCHPKAKWIDHVALRVDEKRYWFVIDYGYKNNGGWEEIFCVQKVNEPFSDFVVRADRRLNQLVKNRKNMTGRLR